MNIKYHINVTLSLLLTFLIISNGFSQIDPELIQRLKTLGVHEEYIEEIFRSATPHETPVFSSERREIDRYNSLNALEIPANLPDSLKKTSVFGQDIFRNPKLSFASGLNIPTPENYVIGPGDELIIEIWGSSEMNFREKVTPEGTVYLSGVGPVQVNGYTIGEATRKIGSSLRKIISGLDTDSRMKVSLGEIRSVNVHIIGEAITPGSYTLPALGTLFNALYLAGGPGEIGSLRDIRLVRNNETITRLDVYQVLIHGKTASNTRLEEGDVILIPPYQAHITINGEVKRENHYELMPGETLADLLRFCGGFKAQAFREELTVHRKSGRQYQLFSVRETDFDSFVLQDGDSVHAGKIIDLYANRVTISGAVWRPGEYEYGENLRFLSQLIVRAGSLKGDEFADRGHIIRMRPDFSREIVAFSVQAASRGEADIELYPEDEVYIPCLEEMTERRYIIVRGEVNRPDTLEFRHNMTVEDAIIMAGGLKEKASMAQVSVARRIKDAAADEFTGRLAETFTFPVRVGAEWSTEQKELTLQPFDEVYIRRSPVYFAQQGAMVSGEILFEGNYAFSRVGERVSELIGKAGGVSPEAYTRGASLIRTMTPDEKTKVEAKLSMADRRTGKDSLNLELLQITDTYSVGIDLEKALNNPGSINDIVLRDGDRIHIPKLDNTVKISGAVLYANTVTFEGGRKNLKNYISQAGGYTDAARRRPYVVYMNGKVASVRRGFLCKRYPQVEPGCEIIVPEKTVRHNRIGLLEMMNLTASTTTMAAMVATLLK